LVRLEGRRDRSARLPQESWRAHGIGVLRIAFGLIWAVDAYFKWQPAFLNHLTDYVTGALAGQPAAVRSWIHFWHHIIGVDPHVFAYLVAAGETAVALALILGVFSNLAYVLGILLSLVIWSTAEGFGGPYTSGSTDIDAAVMYALVFVGLLLANGGVHIGLDGLLTRRLGRLGFLASGDFGRGRDQGRSSRD
jgi:uncharacterized membrane protein YphA (DoxX/SURF4 family)